MDDGTKWMYLNGHVGYGDWHHQIAEQLAARAGVNDHDTKAISNYALVNAIPAMEGHDLAWGHLHHNMPVFWNTNVERSPVSEAVSRGISAADWATQDNGGRAIGDDSLNSDDYNQNGGNVAVAGWHFADAEEQAMLDANRGTDLIGLPPATNVPGHGPLHFGSNADLQRIAREYTEGIGQPYHPPQTYRRVVPEEAAAIAKEYDNTPHNPADPQVAASYDALKRETHAQYDALAKNGYSMDFYPDYNPYPGSPREATLDLHRNKHIYNYPTEGLPGDELGNDWPADHPMLEQVPGVQWGGRPVTYNDMFRGVHDVFGHATYGVGFRHDGEDNAWRHHVSMYTPLARGAMTTETRGQNSWVNFGPHGEHNQTANQDTSIYPDQKAMVMPEWTYNTGIEDDPALVKTGMAHEAMPYHNNTWYHVTPQSYLPSIAEHGLLPQTMGSSQPNWPGVPRENTAVYLHPNLDAAMQMADHAQRFDPADVGHGIPGWPLVNHAPDKAAILRVTGIDRNQVVPDPEAFQRTMEEWGNIKQENHDNPGGLHNQELTPAGEHYLQDFEPEDEGWYDHGGIPDAIETVKGIHQQYPEEMADLARQHADDEGNPMMTLGGTVHPDNIHYVHLPSQEEWYEGFQPSDSAQRRIEHRDDYDMHDQEQEDWMMDNEHTQPPDWREIQDSYQDDPSAYTGDEYAPQAQYTPLRDYVQQRWPHNQLKTAANGGTAFNYVMKAMGGTQVPGGGIDGVPAFNLPDGTNVELRMQSQKSPYSRDPIMYLVWITVNPEKQGTGTQVMNLLKQYSDQTGLKLQVHMPADHAHGFYDKFDWLDHPSHYDYNYTPGEGRMASVFANLAPWYIADGHVIVGNYGQTREEIGWEEGLTYGTVDLEGTLTAHTGNAANIHHIASSIERRYENLPVTWNQEVSAPSSGWWIESEAQPDRV